MYATWCILLDAKVAGPVPGGCRSGHALGSFQSDDFLKYMERIAMFDFVCFSGRYATKGMRIADWGKVAKRLDGATTG